MSCWLLFSSEGAITSWLEYEVAQHTAEALYCKRAAGMPWCLSMAIASQAALHVGSPCMLPRGALHACTRQC